MSSHYTTWKLYMLAIALLLISCKSTISTKEDVINYLKTFGNGSWMFGQVATWVHNENPNMDHPSNWLQKIYTLPADIPTGQYLW